MLRGHIAVIVAWLGSQEKEKRPIWTDLDSRSWTICSMDMDDLLRMACISHKLWIRSLTDMDDLFDGDDSWKKDLGVAFF